MNIQYFLFPLIVFAIFAVWLCIGYRINKGNSTKGFIFLSIYALLATHGCLATNEDCWSIPSENEREIDSFLTVNKNKSYEFHLIKLNKEQYVRVRPISENAIVNLFYQIYRNILLNSWIPEYIFSLNGNLVDWTQDNQDDGRYQDKWDRSKELKEIQTDDVINIIK